MDLCSCTIGKQRVELLLDCSPPVLTIRSGHALKQRQLVLREEDFQEGHFRISHPGWLCHAVLAHASAYANDFLFLLFNVVCTDDVVELAFQIAVGRA